MVRMWQSRGDFSIMHCIVHLYGFAQVFLAKKIAANVGHISSLYHFPLPIVPSLPFFLLYHCQFETLVSHFMGSVCMEINTSHTTKINSHWTRYLCTHLTIEANHWTRFENKRRTSIILKLQPLENCSYSFRDNHRLRTHREDPQVLRPRHPSCPR